jgi:hypothetical protein
MAIKRLKTPMDFHSWYYFVFMTGLLFIKTGVFVMNLCLENFLADLSGRAWISINRREARV